ncbi:methyltransferase domain-containing protein [uncultured Acetobacteroides sp.]|uniref:class I SAM-dependent methyltransferase n=1 Tax=uncultured Acetobacteroides sp. TaxID=1760811 RepID=UPI0029F474D9|nr:methyltransferase domain-containing protein [uncultured Acetobacteroides sp.]
MATDTKQIVANLLSFYDFTDKTIVSVGAGGGQFIEYGRSAKKVYAVDNDKYALAKLEENLQKANLSDKFTLIHSEFEDITQTADIVLFEFCLHEMKDARAAISHALTLSSNILVSDHYPTSEWAYIVDEREKATASWNAIDTFSPRKVEQHDTVQSFADYEELYQKVKGQGEATIQRIEKYQDQTNLQIPMSYVFAMI